MPFSRSTLRPLLPAGSAPAPPSYLLPSGAFDRRAIMRQAHALIRAERARHADLGIEPWPYELLLKDALVDAWRSARIEREVLLEDRRLAAMSPEVAHLIRERAIALHIDSLPEMTRTLAAIDARAAALGVRL